MPENTTSSNKRIAKNTLHLYARMLLLLGLSLYTSRIVLATLGVEDFGLYNVVGGIVTMFAFLNAAMGNSSHRFITFSLGKGDIKESRDVFGATCLIHWILAGVILILAETIGLWLLHNKMVIPESRMVAADWVYQFSIIACVISIITVPYNATIIAHEKMGAFAYITILDAVLKLLIVYLIQISSFDKLIFYAALILCVKLLDIIIYLIYCLKNFEETRNFRVSIKIPQFKEMTSFAGWSLIGNLAYAGYTQGLNILLNLFFGPAINAARGVAVQIEGAVKGFVVNFQTAVNPQIIKSYAQGDYSRLHTLIFASSKFSFFLLLCMVMPICIESNTILNIWLKEVPQYTALFTILILIISLSEPLRNPIDRANQATGKIRNYQIVEGGLLLLIVPLSYLILKIGGEPYAVFIVQLVVMYSVQVARLFLVCHKIKMSKREYVKRVLIRVTLVTIFSSIIPLVIHFSIPQSLVSSIIVIILSVVCVLSCSFFIGLTKNERFLVISKIAAFKSKVTHRS